MSNEIVRPNLSENKISIGIVDHQVSFTESFAPNNEYTINSFIFTDAKGEQSDGCVFKIEPKGSTSVMKITDPNFSCQRIAIKGSGYCLRYNTKEPNRGVELYELDADKDENPLIELSEGWIDCFIAGDKGLEVVDISTPKFNPNVEEYIPAGSHELPKEYWTTFNQLKQND